MKSTVNLLGPLAGPWERLKKGWLLYHLANDNYRFMFEPPPPDEWVSLDCETTGLDRRRDEIISIGAVRIAGSSALHVAADVDAALAVCEHHH